MKKCLYYGQLLALMLVIMLATSCTVSGETALDKYIKKGELRLEEQSLLNAASSGARLLSLSPSGRYVIALEQYAGMSAMSIVDLEKMDSKIITADYANSVPDEYGSMKKFMNTPELQKHKRFSWSPDEQKVAVWNYKAVINFGQLVSNLYVIDVSTGKLQMQYGWGTSLKNGPVGSIVNARFSNDGQELYFSKDRGGMLSYASYNLKTRKISPRCYAAFKPDGVKSVEWEEYLEQILVQDETGYIDESSPRLNKMSDAEWETFVNATREYQDRDSGLYSEANLERTPAQSYVRSLSARYSKYNGMLEIFTAKNERKEYPIPIAGARVMRMQVSPQTGWGLIIYRAREKSTNTLKRYFSVFQPDRDMQGYDQVIALNEIQQCVKISLEDAINATDAQIEIHNAALSPDGKYALILAYTPSGDYYHSYSLHILELATLQCRKVETPEKFDYEARFYMVCGGTDTSSGMFPDGMLWGENNMLLLGRKLYYFAGLSEE